MEVGAEEWAYYIDFLYRWFSQFFDYLYDIHSVWELGQLQPFLQNF